MEIGLGHGITDRNIVVDDVGLSRPGKHSSTSARRNEAIWSHSGAPQLFRLTDVHGKVVRDLLA